MTTISLGEPSSGVISGDTRMGKPAWGNAQAPLAEYIGQRGERGELKHLSTPRKKDHSLSSGERKGSSPNSCRAIGTAVATWGL